MVFQRGWVAVAALALCAGAARAQDAPVVMRMPPAFTVADVNVEAQTVEVRSARSFEGRSGLSLDGKRRVTVWVAKREPGSLRLANGARLQRIEPSLESSQLKVGDRVSLREPPHYVSLQGPVDSRPISVGFISAREFTVLSASPLRLRAGLEAGEKPGEEVARLPFSLSTGGAPIGEVLISRPLGDAPGTSQAFRVTLSITKPQALRFERVTNLGLEQIAQAVREGEQADVELGAGPDGARQVRALSIYQGAPTTTHATALVQSLAQPRRVPLAPNELWQKLQR